MAGRIIVVCHYPPGTSQWRQDRASDDTELARDASGQPPRRDRTCRIDACLASDNNPTHDTRQSDGGTHLDDPSPKGRDQKVDREILHLSALISKRAQVTRWDLCLIKFCEALRDAHVS